MNVGQIRQRHYLSIHKQTERVVFREKSRSLKIFLPLRVLLETELVYALFEPNQKSGWAVLEVGYRLFTQTKARNSTSIFCTIF